MVPRKNLDYRSDMRRDSGLILPELGQDTAIVAMTLKLLFFAILAVFWHTFVFWNIFRSCCNFLGFGRGSERFSP